MDKRFIIYFLIVLVTVVTGCGGAHRYDSRLVAVDSLLQVNPDSALALVEALSPDSLVNDGDRAYRDLLLTQARYKCYITATSDSDINRALDYYRRHTNDREKLTRAYIYKGAVMDELNHPDSAMFYYKTAEATAAPTDYANLGYIKMRMGSLYNSYYAMDGKEILKYEEALKCYQQTTDTNSLFKCMNNLGCCYRESNPEKAEKLLHRAYTLAYQINDTNYIISNTHAFIVLYLYTQQYEKAHSLIRQLMQYKPDIKDYQLWFTVSNVYANLHIPDSAQFFFDLANKYQPADKTPNYQMYYFDCLSAIELANSDTLLSLTHQHESKRISDSLSANVEKLIILDKEYEFDKSLLIKNQSGRIRLTKGIKAVIALFVLTLLLLFIAFYQRKHKYDQLILELKQESHNQAEDEIKLQEHFKQVNTNDKDLNAFISSHINMMRKVIEACYHSPTNVLANEIKNIVEFQSKNKNNWDKLYVFIDKEFNGIMKYTQENHPQLNERDLLLLALTCMDYSCAQIAIIMGYANASTIGGNRQRLARKMKLSGSLNDYILQFKNSNCS